MSLKDIYGKEEENLDNFKTRSQLKIESEQGKSKFNESNFKLVLGMVLSLLVFSAWQIKKLWLDDSILAFQCASTPSLDASIRLPRLDKSSAPDLEHLVRGFTRRYIRARYPKNETEARYMWKYVADNSTGRIKMDFTGRLQILVEGKEKMEGSISVYPTNSKLITIREKSSGVWEVRVPVRRVMTIGSKGDERTEPVISMIIEAGEATFSGSNSGLVVSDYKVSYIPDTISGKEIILE